MRGRHQNFQLSMYPILKMKKTKFENLRFFGQCFRFFVVELLEVHIQYSWNKNLIPGQKFDPCLLVTIKNNYMNAIYVLHARHIM